MLLISSSHHLHIHQPHVHKWRLIGLGRVLYSGRVARLANRLSSHSYIGFADFQLPTSFAHREWGVEARLAHGGREECGALMMEVHADGGRGQPLGHQHWSRCLGFANNLSQAGSFLALPFWFLVLTTGSLAMIFQIHWPWRFTLRSLFIVTTLLAVVLGMIA
jgi:hypothetical protein